MPTTLATYMAANPGKGPVESAVEVILDNLSLAPPTAVANPGTDATQAVAVQGVTNGKPVPVSDAGPAWTTSNGIAGARFTSVDQSAAVASVTDSPTSGKKLVITDIIISVDTAMRVDFTVESSATVIETIYMAANTTVNVITRGKRKLATADKKLQVKTSVAGNISVNAFYYSE